MLQPLWGDPIHSSTKRRNRTTQRREHGNLESERKSIITWNHGISVPFHVFFFLGMGRDENWKVQGVRGPFFFNTLVTMWSSLFEWEHSKVSAASTSRNARWDRVRLESWKENFCSWCFSQVFSVGVPYKVPLMCTGYFFWRFVINLPQKSTQRFELQWPLPRGHGTTTETRSLGGRTGTQEVGHSITGGFWWWFLENSKVSLGFFYFFLDENWWFWSDGSRGCGVTSCGSWILRQKEREREDLRNLKNCKVGIFILRQEEERKRREVEKQENWDSNNISATKERFTRSSLQLLKTIRCTLSVCNHSHHHLVEWHANTPRHRDENRNLFLFLDRTFLVSVGAAQEGSWTAEKHGNVQAFDFFRFCESRPFRHFPRLDSLGKQNNFHKTNVLPPWKATWKKYRKDSIEKHRKTLNGMRAQGSW